MKISRRSWINRLTLNSARRNAPWGRYISTAKSTVAIDAPKFQLELGVRLTDLSYRPPLLRRDLSGRWGGFSGRLTLVEASEPRSRMVPVRAQVVLVAALFSYASGEASVPPGAAHGR